MSTDQYPEVSSDDSGLVPQTAPRPEWPKKIRTLTAAELDRLTIDGDGRFYWDGHLVNYQPPQPVVAETSPPSAPVDLDALALLDRAARELSGRPQTEATVADQPAQPAAQGETVAQMQSVAAPVVAVPALAPATDARQIAPTFDVTYRTPVERLRLRMSFWQSSALVLLILVLVVGAAGIAVSGLVAAHEWGCRTKLIQQYCPPPPPEPKAPARIDIPA
jgi:hypothetical protein